MNFILGADIGGPCNDFVESKLKQSEYRFFVADEPLTGVNKFEKLIIKLK